jgi:undecaprenyl phosphate-alpha-L-ara4N flippase subunit ArnE
MPDEKKENLAMGIPLILISALFTSAGQLLWKLGTVHFALILVGFVLYGCGALAMIGAFRFGEISVLHPMLSVSYVLSLVLGALVLHEAVTAHKIAGIALVIVGMVFLGLSSASRKKV